MSRRLPVHSGPAPHRDEAAPSDAQLPHPTKHRRVGWLALPLAAVVVGLVVLLMTRPDAATRLARSPLVGRPAPATSGTTIDGMHADLGQLRGRWVVVNFFATWCVPCREEHPSLVEFSERHARAGDAAVLGIVYADDVAAVRAFRADEGGEWPMLVDPDGRLAIEYGVAGVPESFLIDPDGTVATKIVGGVRLDALEEILANANRARGVWP